MRLALNFKLVWTLPAPSSEAYDPKSHSPEVVTPEALEAVARGHIGIAGCLKKASADINCALVLKRLLEDFGANLFIFQHVPFRTAHVYQPCTLP